MPYRIHGTVLKILILLFLAPAAAYGAQDLSLYEDYRFSIEHPADWQVHDTWDSQQQVLLGPGGTDRSGITITLADKYLLASERSTISIDSMGLLDTITEDLYETCKANRLGACWNYELLDSKITTVSGRQAISVKYAAVLEDVQTTIRLVLLPDGERFWRLEARSMGAGFGAFEDAVESFRLASHDGGPRMPVPDTDPGIAVHRGYEVNLVLVGGEWSRQAKASIQARLPEYIDPINHQTYDTMAVRHSYDYNFVSVTGDQVGKLAEFMHENSRSAPLFGSEYDWPVWQASWVETHHQYRDPAWIEYDDRTGKPVFLIDYRLVDALAVEEYVYEKFVGSNPDLSGPSSVNLVFLAMGLDQADFLRNYSVYSTDDASGYGFSSVGLRGYGGNYNMMFFDLYAAPWHNFDLLYGQYHTPDLAAGDVRYMDWYESMHDCSTDRCLADTVSLHAESALRHVVSPPVLYSIQNADRYVLDVLVYTKPGQADTLNPATLKYFVNEAKIVREFEYLYPFAEWQVEFTLEKRDTRGLTHEFKDALTDTRGGHVDGLKEQKYVQVLDIEEIKPHLLSWAAERKAEGRAGAVTIPVLVEVGSSDTADLYLGKPGVLGIAPSMPDSDEPCCALAVTSQKRVWSEKIGFTDLLIHEAGHALGLMHPFMTITDPAYPFPTVNEYFNWYSSPMTYSSPGDGCGLLYYVIYDAPCGNASLSFTEFERNMVSDVRLAHLWGETESNIRSGGNDAAALLAESKRAYSTGDLYSLKGALVLARDAYASSVGGGEADGTQRVPASVQPAPRTVPADAAQKIPDWVKNNAGWWADGSIDDGTFVRGIEFLIREGIISVPETTGSSSGGHVPAWVKNNARWWADGQITGDDFLRGIEFLVAHGVIRVD